jgi:enoyl-CoA hydratase/carnithine racemase
MNRKYVSYTLSDGIATVIIDNPPVNAMDPNTMGDLAAVFDELHDTKDQVKVVILTAAGEKAFVAGGDIKTFSTINPETARARVKKARERLLKIEHFERPVICAINGFCLGGGLELAMCCDIRIAADHVKLGQPEINIGVIPGVGGTQRLARLVGEGVAKELIFTGRFVEADEAKSIGLVNKVVHRHELLNEANEMAKLIASKPILSLRAAKEAIHRGLSLTLEQGLDIENEYFCFLCGTQDQKEGAAAFIEKRKPNFLGR